MKINPLNADLYLLGQGLKFNGWRNEFTNYLKLYFEDKTFCWDELGLTYLRLINSLRRLEKRGIIENDKTKLDDGVRCQATYYRITDKGLKWIQSKLNKRVNLSLMGDEFKPKFKKQIAKLTRK